MKKGGYQILDLSGVGPFTAGEAQNVPGMSEVIANSNRKRLIVSGLTIGDVDYPDFGVILTSNGTNYTGNFAGYTMTVANDAVTIAAAG